MKTPNVVLMFADDLGYGDLSCFNKDSKIHTENIDKLASESMRCTDAHASSSLCTPSRYGLMTGRYNWRSRLKYGVISGGRRHLIEDGRLTLGTLFKKAGYNTACVGKWHLGIDWTLGPDADESLAELKSGGFDPLPKIDFEGRVLNGPPAFGFDYSYVTPGSLDIPPYVFIENGKVTNPPNRQTGRVDYITSLRAKEPGVEFMKMYDWPAGDTGSDYNMMQVVPDTAERVLKLIDDYSSRPEPFFIYYPIHAPHTPCLPTPEFDGKSGIGPYGDMVLMIDSIVGRLVERLKEKGVYDDTIFIFTSDNGSAQHLEDKGHRSNSFYRGYKTDIWDGGHRIPFIVRYPGTVQPGSTCDQTTCLTDMVATFADILGIELADNEGEDSVSSLPLWKGSDQPVRTATVHTSGRGRFAIRKGKWKLELWHGSGGNSPDPAVPEGGTLPPVQLYDMEADPSETVNVWAEHPDIVKELTEELTAYVVNGRSTPGTPQKNTGGDRWDQLDWM